MPLVFAAGAVHAPGITGRPRNATEQQRGETLCFEPIPAYAITGAIATMAV